MKRCIIALAITLCTTVVYAADFNLPVTLDASDVRLLKERWGTPEAPADNPTTQARASEVCSQTLKGLANEQLVTMGSDVTRAYNAQAAARKQVIFDRLKELKEGR